MSVSRGGSIGLIRSTHRTPIDNGRWPPRKLRGNRPSVPRGEPPHPWHVVGIQSTFDSSAKAHGLGDDFSSKSAPHERYGIREFHGTSLRNPGSGGSRG